MNIGVDINTKGEESKSAYFIAKSRRKGLNFSLSKFFKLTKNYMKIGGEMENVDKDIFYFPKDYGVEKLTVKQIIDRFGDYLTQEQIDELNKYGNWNKDEFDRMYEGINFTSRWSGKLRPKFDFEFSPTINWWIFPTIEISLSVKEISIEWLCFALYYSYGK
jgi:hypothetical protein